MIREMRPPEKIYAGSQCFYKHLVWMHLQLQISQQKTLHLQQNILKPYSVSRKNNEIVGITDILLDLQSVLHKLVEFIHVDIHKQL